MFVNFYCIMSAIFACPVDCTEMFLLHFMQENRERLEQFFAEYGEAGKKVFEEDTDDDEDKETIDKEGNRDSFEEEKYVKNILQGTDLTTQGDKLKKKVQTDLKETLQVTDKEWSQVADIFTCTERE